MSMHPSFLSVLPRGNLPTISATNRALARNPLKFAIHTRDSNASSAESIDTATFAL